MPFLFLGFALLIILVVAARAFARMKTAEAARWSRILLGLAAAIFGGLLTLFTVGYMVAYTLECFVKVMNFDENKISSYMIKDDRLEMEPMNLHDNGFDMVFGFAD